MAESPACDRIAFAYSLSRNRTAQAPSGEKVGRSPRCRRAARSLESGLSGNNREIRAFFVYFGTRRADFLCTSDCMAEGEGFEPSVRFFHAKPRHIRKLQIAKPYQRISPYNPTSEALQSVRFRFAVHSAREGERQAILGQN